MSADLQSITLRDRLAGKWQVPLFVLASFLFAVALLMLRPEPRQLTVAEHVEHIRSFKNGLLLTEAEHYALAIVQGGQFERAELGPIYAELATTQFQIQSRRVEPQPDALIRALANYEQAEMLAYRLSGEECVNRGQMYEWLNQPGTAIDQYRLALTRRPPHPLDVRRRVLAIQHDSPNTPRSVLHEGYDALLQDAQQDPEILNWALAQKVSLLIEETRLKDGHQLIDKVAPLLADTRYAAHVKYLTAWVAYKDARYDKAERILRDLRSEPSSRDELHAQTGWLLGNVVLMDDEPQRPMEAILYFQDVLQAHPRGEYVTASKLGMAEALSSLEEFDEALSYYRSAVKDLETSPASRLINRKTICTSLVVRGRMLEAAQLYDQAVEYLRLAVDLVEISEPQVRIIYMKDLVLLEEFVANYYREQALVTEQNDDLETAESLAQKSRDLFVATAQDYLAIADIRHDEDSEVADSLWKAAEMYDAAGRREKTITLLEQFIADRPASDHLPMALFKIGQAYQAQGQLLDAVEKYQQCIAQYSRTQPAQLSLIPLADCFVMLGPDYAEKAEQTLLYILEPNPDQPFMFTPQSGIYREALFKLGVVYSRSGRYEDAIYRLNEALQRYPQDPSAGSATFLIADAYRQSGLEVDRLAGQLANAIRREEMYATKRQRLEKAKQLFGSVITRLSTIPRNKLSEMEALQLMLSYVYRADCAFDVGDYASAHALYEEVVQKYQEHPVMLSAYVQIISCLEKLNRVAEIKPALERAQYLTKKIDAGELQSQVIRNITSDWQRLFSWLAQTQRYR